MANIYTKQQLEDFTRKTIVAAPSGLYKLCKLEGVKSKTKGKNSKGYSLEFCSCTAEGKMNGSHERIFVKSPYYTLDFLCDIFSICHSYNHVDSYVEREDVAKTNKFSIETKSANGLCEDLDYFREFIINYAKQEQNEYNELRRNKERFDLKFQMLNQK